MTARYRASRVARVVLIVVWSLVGLLVVSDLGEGVRGDKSLMSVIPWNLGFGLLITLIVVVLDVNERRDRAER